MIERVDPEGTKEVIHVITKEDDSGSGFGSSSEHFLHVYKQLNTHEIQEIIPKKMLLTSASYRIGFGQHGTHNENKLARKVVKLQGRIDGSKTLTELNSDQQRVVDKLFDKVANLQHEAKKVKF